MLLARDSAIGTASAPIAVAGGNVTAITNSSAATAGNIVVRSNGAATMQATTTTNGLNVGNVTLSSLSGAPLVVSGLSAPGGTFTIAGGAATESVVGPLSAPNLVIAPNPIATPISWNVTINSVAQFTQIVAAGTVTLTDNPTLNVVLSGYTPAGNNSFKIIDNDGTSDAVVGTFNGLPEGQTFTLSGTLFKITYAGGDGNDVVISEQMPTLLYVNDQFSSGVVDGDAEQAGFQTANVGYDAFNSVAAALATYPNFNGPIIVNGGTYASANLAGGGNVSLRLVQDIAANEFDVRLQNLSGDAGDSITTRFYSSASANLIVEQGSFAGSIGGGGSLVKSGTGTVLLSGSNSYAGGTLISQGTIQSATPASTQGTITLGDANTGGNSVAWLFAGATTPSNPIVVTSFGSGTATIGSYSGGLFTEHSGPITLNRATTFSDGTGDRTSFLGQITGNVGLITIGGTRITFDNGANNFVGDLLVPGGSTYQNNAAGALPDATNVTVNGAFQLNNNSETINALNGSGTVRNIVGSNTLTVGGNNGTGTFTGTITNNVGVFSLVKAGTGTQSLNGASNYSGGTIVRAGVFQVGNGTGAGTGTVTLNDASTGVSNASFLATGAFTVANPIVVVNQGSGISTVGTTSFNPGAVATLFTGAVTLNKATTFQGGNTDRTTWQGVISGSPGTVTIAGNARTTWEATNTFVGNVNITGSGTQFQIGTGAASSNVIPDTSNVDVAAGNFFYFNTGAEAINGLSGGGTVQKHPSVGGLTTFTVGSSGATSTFTGTIANGGGTVALVKAGAGVQSLNGASSYSGGTTVRQGTLQIGAGTGAGTGTVTLNDASTGANNTSFLATGAFTVANPIVVANQGSGVSTIGTTTFNPGAVATFFTGAVTLNKATTFQGGNTDRTTWQGIIGGSPGTITIAGNARTTWEATNTFVGNVNIVGAGTQFQIGTGGATSNVIPDAASVDVAAGNFFYFNTGAEAINGLTGGGTVQKHPSVGGLTTFTVGAGGATASFAGTIANGGGTVALVKAGGGVQTLTGANTYTAGTTVQAGTLLVNNTTGSGTGTGAVIVQSGATLGGTGSISGPVTVQSGGFLSPGTSPADIATGNLTLSAGSTYTVELNGPVANTGYDQTLVTGTVDVTGATLNLVVGYTPGASDVFVIVRNDGTDGVVGTFAGRPELSPVILNGRGYHITYTYNADTSTIGGGNDIALIPNRAPVAIAGSYATSEGVGLSLSASASSDPDGDVLTYRWDVDGDGDFDENITGTTATVSWAALQALGIDDGPQTRTIRVEANDGLGGVSVSTATNNFVFSNAPPTAALSGPTLTGPGQPVNFTFSATDPSATDTAGNFTYNIDWNNDTIVDQTVVGPGSGVVVPHAFPTLGTHTVSVTATDKDGDTSAAATQNIDVVPVYQDGNGNIVAGGLDNFDDQFSFSLASGGKVQVTWANAASAPGGPYPTKYGPFTLPSEARLLAYGQGGNDTITTTVTGVPVSFDGGAGNDYMAGSTANDSFIGGEGNDRVVAGNGNDFIDGGSGADSVDAGADNDTVFGGAGVDTLNGGAGNDLMDGGDDGDIMNGGAGSDIMFGGNGNDNLNGVSDNDVLVGGEGDDILSGDVGRDILLGGNNKDTLNGGGDDDVLAGGLTSYDNYSVANANAVQALLAEWGGSNPYATRVTNLRTGGGVTGGARLNPGTAAGPITVTNDDGFNDTVNGGIGTTGGTDWFLASTATSGANKDTTDRVLTGTGAETLN